LPERPGWYRDPYGSEMQRWFDGTRRTTHPVSGSDADPDRAVEQNWSVYSPEQLRRLEWEEQYPHVRGEARNAVLHPERVPGYWQRQQYRDPGVYLDRRFRWWRPVTTLVTVLGLAALSVTVVVQTVRVPAYRPMWVVVSSFLFVATPFTVIRGWRRWPGRREAIP
jgi:hypothetical protein